MNYLLKIFLFALFFSIFWSAQPALADTGTGYDILNQINASADKTGVTAPKMEPQAIIAGLIKAILTIFGTIFLILMVLGGYWILTAKGDDTQVDKGRKTISGAIIGLVITLAAYSITIFFGSSAKKITTPGAMEPKDQAMKWSDL